MRVFLSVWYFDSYLFAAVHLPRLLFIIYFAIVGSDSRRVQMSLSFLTWFSTKVWLQNISKSNQSQVPFLWPSNSSTWGTLQKSHMKMSEWCIHMTERKSGIKSTKMKTRLSHVRTHQLSKCEFLWRNGITGLTNKSSIFGCRKQLYCDLIKSSIQNPQRISAGASNAMWCQLVVSTKLLLFLHHLLFSYPPKSCSERFSLQEIRILIHHIFISEPPLIHSMLVIIFYTSWCLK